MSDERSIPEQKAALRKAARLTRDALSHEVVLDWSIQIIDRVLRIEPFAAAPSVFVYVSVKNEVRTRDLIEALWDRDVHVLVPLMFDDQLGMCELHDWSEIRVDSYGRCTPISDAKIFNGEPEITLVPGLAFSALGQRLGSGYGHYDRFLAKHPKTLAIGLAYELQLQASLPTEPHDQLLDYVVTQDHVIRVAG